MPQPADGEGPRLIEALTYRLGDHTTADDAARYRPPEEVQAHWKEEPIARLRAFLVGQKMWSKAEEERLAAECQARIEAAVERYLATAPAQRRKPCSIISTQNCPRPMLRQRRRARRSGPMSEVTLVDAVNLALARAMEDDPTVVVLGEDVGVNGGVFRATAGLQAALRIGARPRHAACRAPDQRPLRRHGGCRG